MNKNNKNAICHELWHVLLKKIIRFCFLESEDREMSSGTRGHALSSIPRSEPGSLKPCWRQQVGGRFPGVPATPSYPYPALQRDGNQEAQNISAHRPGDSPRE